MRNWTLKKYPVIEPQFLKNKQRKAISVYLDYKVYESIFKEMKDLRSEIKELKKLSCKKEKR